MSARRLLGHTFDKGKACSRRFPSRQQTCRWGKRYTPPAQAYSRSVRRGTAGSLRCSSKPRHRQMIPRGTGHTPSCACDCHTIPSDKAGRLLSRADPDITQLRRLCTCQASSCQRSDWPYLEGTARTPTGRTECCTCRGHTECTPRLPLDSCNPDHRVNTARMTWHQSEADSIQRGRRYTRSVRASTRTFPQNNHHT